MKYREFLKDYLENASTTERLNTILLICLIAKSPNEIEAILDKDVDVSRKLTCNCQIDSDLAYTIQRMSEDKIHETTNP